MKTKILILLLFLLAIPLHGVSASPGLPPGVTHSPGLWVITPHNSSPDDPNRIQAVVDMAQPGDTVRLGAGTFDFSEFEMVRIAKDLTLEGAWDSVHQVPLTTIKHGWMPVLIGRKTSVVKPETIKINGHKVYHMTKDLWGKLNFPFTYPGGENYNILDDWTPANVNVRQIAFERPFQAAIYSGAMNGGVIERVRIHSTWPINIDFEFGGTGSMGVGWYNASVLPMAVAEWGRMYNPNLYVNTDLVRGNLVVQNSFIDGAARTLQAGERDEVGDLVAVPYADNPIPPNRDYDKYVLQDVAFAWDTNGVVLNSIQLFWVKKGFTAYSVGDQVYVDNGIWAGIYSLFTQSSLNVKNNVIQNCGLGYFSLENGFMGVPFKALIEGNHITPSLTAGWATGINSYGYDHYNPFTGQTTHADPGEFITVRNNTFDVRNPNQGWWEAVIRPSMYGKATVMNNTINLTSGSGIITDWPAQGVVASTNTFTGTGDYAFFADWNSNGNDFLLNNLRGFTPSGTGETDVSAPPAGGILISDNNKVVGGPGSSGQVVWDFGKNNIVIGMVHQIGTLPSAATLNAAPESSAVPESTSQKGWSFKGR